MSYTEIQELWDSHEELYDILLVCSSDRLDDLRTFFEDFVEEYQDIHVLWSGRTQRYGMGILLLECQGALPELLQRELATNKRLTDYTIYPVPTYIE